MKRNINVEMTYPHPPEKVWRAITDPRAISQWLMDNDFEPRVGRKFQFRMKPQPGFNGIIDGEVLEVDPPRRLSYAWRGGPLNTVVTFTLEPVAGGTCLRLEHRGFEGLKGVLLSFMMGGGWKSKMLQKRLPSVLARMDAGGSLPPIAVTPEQCDSSRSRRLFAHFLRLIPGRKATGDES